MIALSTLIERFGCQRRLNIDHPADPKLTQGVLLRFETATVDKCTHWLVCAVPSCFELMAGGKLRRA